VSFLDRLFHRGERTAAEREDRAGGGDRGGDPRGAGSDEYRTADPRELVEEEGTLMGAPGGSPQDAPSVDERRRADLADD
jgi:hypothetical protein